MKKTSGNELRLSIPYRSWWWCAHGAAAAASRDDDKRAKWSGTHGAPQNSINQIIALMLCRRGADAYVENDEAPFSLSKSRSIAFFISTLRPLSFSPNHDEWLHLCICKCMLLYTFDSDSNIFQLICSYSTIAQNAITRNEFMIKFFYSSIRHQTKCRYILEIIGLCTSIKYI